MGGGGNTNTSGSSTEDGNSDATKSPAVPIAVSLVAIVVVVVAAVLLVRRRKRKEGGGAGAAGAGREGREPSTFNENPLYAQAQQAPPQPAIVGGDQGNVYDAGAGKRGPKLGGIAYAASLPGEGAVQEGGAGPSAVYADPDDDDLASTTNATLDVVYADPDTSTRVGDSTVQKEGEVVYGAAPQASPYANARAIEAAAASARATQPDPAALYATVNRKSKASAAADATAAGGSNTLVKQRVAQAAATAPAPAPTPAPAQAQASAPAPAKARRRMSSGAMMNVEVPTMRARKGSAGVDATVVRWRSAAGVDGAATARPQTSYEEHSLPGTGASKVQCQRPSPGGGMCKNSVINGTPFCKGHTCPSCQASKSSAEPFCPRHTGIGEATAAAADPPRQKQPGTKKKKEAIVYATSADCASTASPEYRRFADTFGPVSPGPPGGDGGARVKLVQLYGSAGETEDEDEDEEEEYDIDNDGSPSPSHLATQTGGNAADAALATEARGENTEDAGDGGAKRPKSNIKRGGAHKTSVYDGFGAVDGVNGSGSQGAETSDPQQNAVFGGFGLSINDDEIEL